MPTSSRSPVTLTMIYRPDDFEPEYLTRSAGGFAAAASASAGRNGFDFRMIAVGEVVPACTDRPRLWFHGEDLLEVPQCFQVDDFSPDPQTGQHLKAIARTVRASTSVLLNASFTGADYLAVDKLAIIQHARSLGIATAETIAIPYGRHARTVLPWVRRELGIGPFILKPRELGMGVGVLKVDTEEQLRAAVDVASQSGIAYLIQPYLPNTGDCRIFIVDGEVMAEQQRTPAPGSYAANTSQGGRSSQGRHEELHEDSLRLARSLRASCLQVDWLLTANGPVLSEYSSGFGGYSPLVEPDRTLVGDAFYRWARSQFERAGAGSPSPGEQ